MFGFLKRKKKEEVLVGENTIENNINSATIGSGEVFVETDSLSSVNGEKSGFVKPTEWFLAGEKVEQKTAPTLTMEVPEGLGKAIPKKNITKNRVLERNEAQGSRVLSILKENTEGLTRYEIRDFYTKQFGDILDTSLSRAIACLSYDNKIEMTDKSKIERYGKVCHIYKAN